MNNDCDFFNELYIDSKGEIFSLSRVQEEVQRIIQLMGISRNDRILDHCCGNGRHLKIFQELGYKSIGLDFSQAMVSNAKLSGVDNIFYFDVRDEIVGEYDKIYNIYTSFGYGSDFDIEQVVMQIHNSLSKNGYFLLDIVNAEWLLKNMKQYSKVNSNIVFENSLGGNGRICQIIKNLKNNIKQEIYFKVFYIQEILELFKKIGFSAVKIYGNLKGDEFFTERSKHITILFKKIV